MLAAERGYNAQLKLLLQHGAQTEQSDSDGWTALLFAVTGAWPYNRPCAQQYVGKSQSCMVISGRLIVHAFVPAPLDTQRCAHGP